MPAALDRCLTALSGALALFGVLLISMMLFPAPDDRHGGMSAAAFGLWCVLPTALWLYGVVVSFRTRAWWRWSVSALPAIAMAVLLVLEPLGAP